MLILFAAAKCFANCRALDLWHFPQEHCYCLCWRFCFLSLFLFWLRCQFWVILVCLLHLGDFYFVPMLFIQWLLFCPDLSSIFQWFWLNHKNYSIFKKRGLGLRNAESVGKAVLNDIISLFRLKCWLFVLICASLVFRIGLRHFCWFLLQLWPPMLASRAFCLDNFSTFGVR